MKHALVCGVGGFIVSHRVKRLNRQALEEGVVLHAR